MPTSADTLSSSSVVAKPRAPTNGKTAKLILDGKELELPIIVGTEEERAVDISKLRAKTGYITLDEGYVNTGCDHQRDHLSRRRTGHPALPRLPDRGAGRSAATSSKWPTC